MELAWLKMWIRYGKRLLLSLLLALKEQYILGTPLSTLDSINEDRYYRKSFFWNPVPSLTCQFQTFDSQTLQSEMANIPQRPDISAVVDAFETLAAQATLAQNHPDFGERNPIHAEMEQIWGQLRELQSDLASLRAEFQRSYVFPILDSYGIRAHCLTSEQLFPIKAKMP